MQEGKVDVSQVITHTYGLEEYARAGSAKNLEMVDLICQRLKLTSLKYQALDDLVEAIGLPKEKLCTHCWDGTSYF